MADGLPDRATLRKIFDKFDEDKSGEVSVHEMKAMLRTLKISKTDEEIKQLVKEASVRAMAGVLTSQLAELQRRAVG